MLSYDFHFARNTCIHAGGYDMATCSSQLKQVQLCYYLKHFFIRIAMLKDYGEVLSKKKTNPLLNNRQSLLKLKCGYLRSYLNIHVGGLTSLGLLTRPHTRVEQRPFRRRTTVTMQTLLTLPCHKANCEHHNWKFLTLVHSMSRHNAVI